MSQYERLGDRRGWGTDPRAIAAKGHELCTRPPARSKLECDADTPDWIRDAADERVHANGSHWFDIIQGAYAVWWIERYMRLYEGRWSGEPAVMHSCKTCARTWLIPKVFNPEVAIERARHYAECVKAGHDCDWQYEFLMRLFGWVGWSSEHSRTLRRFRRGDVWIPKKNKKSPTMAFLGWYLTVGDGEPGQKVYFGAKDGSQAKELVGGHAVAAYECSEELQSVCLYRINEMRFTHLPTRSQLAPLSSSNSRNTKSKEGINGSILIDERHVVDAEFMRRIKRAGISRLEPIELGVSTAGLDTTGHGKERQDYGRAVASGEIEDDQFLWICYEADQSIDLEDLTTDQIVEIGKKANPAWGNTISETEFKADFLESKKASLDELFDFGTYRLNIWQHSSNPWLRAGSWEKCGSDFTLDDVEGKECVLGLDLSRTRDMTAACLVFHKEDERRKIYPMFWLPENTAKRHSGKIAGFLDWQKEGHISLTAKDTISQKQVYDELKVVLDRVNCTHVFYDPTFADWLTQELEDNLEITRVVFNQNMSEFAHPTAQLEEEILAGIIEHPNNPILNWQFSHCHVYKNRFTKKRRPVKPSEDSSDPRTIDGVAALTMGMRVELIEPEQTLDYYDTNELEVI